MIKIKCDTKHSLNLDKMRPIQGELKTITEKNYQKLKRQIIDEGFISPFLVWQKDDEYFLLDGHQRHYVLSCMRDQGIEMPELFPIVLMEADNYKQACKRVLAISSQYGSMTDKGLKKFLLDADIDQIDAVEEYQFDIIDFEKWKESEDENDSKESNDSDTDRENESYDIIISCDNIDDQIELLEEFQKRRLNVRLNK